MARGGRGQDTGCTWSGADTAHDVRAAPAGNASAKPSTGPGASVGGLCGDATVCEVEVLSLVRLDGEEGTHCRGQACGCWEQRMAVVTATWTDLREK